MSRRVSVVMSAYNAARYLSASVESILHQTLTDFEFIIVDDASTDETPDIIRDFAARDKRIVPIFNETNQGIPDSFNKGLAVAKGDYIARMDADDISLPLRLERQCEVLDSDPGVVLVGSAFALIDDADTDLGIFHIPCGKSDINRLLWLRPCFAGGAIMMRGDVLRRIGGFRKRIRYSGDYDLCLRLCEVGEAVNISEVLFNYRVHTSHATGKNAGAQADFARLAVLLAAERKVRGIDSLDSLDLSTPEKITAASLGYSLPKSLSPRQAARIHALWSGVLLKRKKISPALRFALRSLAASPGPDVVLLLSHNVSSVLLYACARTFNVGLTESDKAALRNGKMVKREVGRKADGVKAG